MLSAGAKLAHWRANGKSLCVLRTCGNPSLPITGRALSVPSRHTPSTGMASGDAPDASVSTSVSTQSPHAIHLCRSTGHRIQGVRHGQSWHDIVVETYAQAGLPSGTSGARPRAHPAVPMCGRGGHQLERGGAGQRERGQWEDAGAFTMKGRHAFAACGRPGAPPLRQRARAQLSHIQTAAPTAPDPAGDLPEQPPSPLHAARHTANIWALGAAN